MDIQKDHCHHFPHPHVSGQDVILQGGVEKAQGVVLGGGMEKDQLHQGDGTLQDRGLHVVGVLQEMALVVLQQEEEMHRQVDQGRIQWVEGHMLAGRQPVQVWVPLCSEEGGLDDILFQGGHKVVAQLHVGRFVQGEGEGVVQGVGNTQGVEVHSC